MLDYSDNDNQYIEINKEEQQNEINEINIFRRNLENNTHEVIEDMKLKRITSWRKSNTKFLHNLIYNILSFGILHIISLYYPNLYIKLYCNPWPAKECDYFLVENIYGQLTLCLKIVKKMNNNSYNKDSFLSQTININRKFNILKKVTYSFIYKSMAYEYNEDTNKIYPIYMNVSKMTNKNIID